MYNAGGAADIRRSIVPGYLTANENSFSLPLLSFSLPALSRPPPGSPRRTPAACATSLALAARSIVIRFPFPSPVRRDSLFPLFAIPSLPASPTPARHNRSSPAYFSPPLSLLYILCFLLFLSRPPPSVAPLRAVRDNSLVCSLITLRVYTRERGERSPNRKDDVGGEGKKGEKQ